MQSTQCTWKRKDVSKKERPIYYTWYWLFLLFLPFARGRLSFRFIVWTNLPLASCVGWLLGTLSAASQCSLPHDCPSQCYLTGRKAEGNAIFIQSVFRMSSGRNTSPAQSSPTVILFFPRSNHICHKTTTPYFFIPGKKDKKQAHKRNFCAWRQ
jgi:hypothetical protein